MNSFRNTIFFKLSKSFANFCLRHYHNFFVGKKFNKTTIVFESFAGKFINDSPYAIYLELKKQQPDWDLIWSVNKDQIPVAKKMGIKYVQRLRFKWAKTMAMSDAWIANARMTDWLNKTDSIFYLQTWHGTPLKKLGIDIENVAMPGVTTESYRQEILNESKKWDLLLSPNRYSTKIFQQAFNYRKEILEIGYPRNDILFEEQSQNQIDNIKRKLGIPTNKKIILYAPTYRDEQNSGQGIYKFKLPFDLSKLRADFGNDVFLVFRMHYLISDQLNLSEFSGFAKDLSKYPNINDLYLASDALLTDYSSTMFDYAILKRPIMLFFNDENQYKKSRDFYMDKNDLPIKSFDSENELKNSIDQLIKNKFKTDQKQLELNNKFVIYNEGHASQYATHEAIKQINMMKKQ